MENLIKALKQIESEESIEKTDYLTNGYRDDLHPLINVASNLACEELITDSGSCNWDNIKSLKEQGYNVFAGEKDSFGWLTGCIRTSKGIVVFG